MHFQQNEFGLFLLCKIQMKDAHSLLGHLSRRFPSPIYSFKYKNWFLKFNLIRGALFGFQELRRLLENVLQWPMSAAIFVKNALALLFYQIDGVLEIR